MASLQITDAQRYKFINFHYFFCIGLGLPLKMLRKYMKLTYVLEISVFFICVFLAQLILYIQLYTENETISCFNFVLEGESFLESPLMEYGLKIRKVNSVQKMRTSLVCGTLSYML